MPPILAIVDDPHLAIDLEQALHPVGYTVICLSDAGVATRHFDQAQPVAVLVALTHPYGWDLLRQFTQRAQIPVVALAPGEEEAICALEQGADDALCIPYQVRELQARVRARLRPILQNGLSVTEESLDYVRCGPVLIDLPRYYATLYHVPLDLSPLEFELLVLFVRAPEQVWSKREIFERVWRMAYIEGDRALDSMVLRLRRKLGDFGDALETVWGRGYRLHWQPQSSDAWQSA
jgi:DNA-binding response OmpR family regulator